MRQFPLHAPDGQAFGDQHVRDPQALGAQAVVELVVGKRHDQLGHPSTKSLGRGSYAPVVHDSRNAWQQQRERHMGLPQDVGGQGMGQLGAMRGNEQAK